MICGYNLKKIKYYFHTYLNSYFELFNIAFWLDNQNNKNIKNADTPVPMIELKKNLVEISVSVKANSKFIIKKILINNLLLF